MPYSNPYWVPGGAGNWDYSQPIPSNAIDANLPSTSNPDANLPLAGNPDANLTPNGNPDANGAADRFRAGDYAGALPLVDRAIQAQPSDAAAHELRALILFATEDYSQAAATIHAVLAIGPGWDWTTLSSFYPDIQIYMKQLHALQTFVSKHPQQADARFLLAYHYLTQGHAAEATAELRKIVHLMPDDKLAAELLRMVQGGNAAPPPNAAAPAPAGADLKPIDPGVLVGSWQASRDDGSKFNLSLAADKTFTWKFSPPQQQQSQTISGTYTIDKGLLTMQDKTGGTMAGQLSAADGNRFTFKPVGGPPDDPGLTFTK